MGEICSAYEKPLILTIGMTSIVHNFFHYRTIDVIHPIFFLFREIPNIRRLSLLYKIDVGDSAYQKREYIFSDLINK